MKYRQLFSLIVILLISACETGTRFEPTTSKQPTPHLTNEIDLPTIVPTQTILPDPNPIESAEKEAENKWKGNQVPIFLEITQTTIMNNDSAQGPTLGVGPTIYFYHPDSKILMLHSTITCEPTTELFVGVNNIFQTPNQIYEKKTIIQYPSAQPDLIQISFFDLETGIIKLVYADEAFTLSPGESRTFKQISNNSKAPMIILNITNHGQLIRIQRITGNTK